MNTPASQNILDIQNLKTYFYLKEGTVRAVDGVDLQLEPGEVLGIVGESGCGKSITAHSILRIIQPPGKITEGSILYSRRDGGFLDLTSLSSTGDEIRGIRGKEINMIFQEPMTAFSPVHTIGSQVSEVVRLHEQIGKTDSMNRAVEMFRRVGIPRAESVCTNYPHQLSGGMRQRAMIAMALMCDPRILIADEPTTAVDVTLQAQILRLLQHLQKDLDLSIIFITHDLGVIAQVAKKVAVMYLGKVVEFGSVFQIFDQPKHPYTADLLRSIPRLGEEDSLATIRGSVPDPYSIPRGCFFHPRCSHVMAGICDGKEFPPQVDLDEDHRVSCYLYDGRDRDHG